MNTQLHYYNVSTVSVSENDTGDVGIQFLQSSDNFDKNELTSSNI
jgi:hypothetical protein